MLNPTSKWTHEERTEIILSLKERLLDLRHSQLPTAENVYAAADLKERIHLLENMSAGFLEDNRSTILNGKKWSTDRLLVVDPKTPEYRQ